MTAHSAPLPSCSSWSHHTHPCPSEPAQLGSDFYWSDWSMYQSPLGSWSQRPGRRQAGLSEGTLPGVSAGQEELVPCVLSTSRADLSSSSPFITALRTGQLKALPSVKRRCFGVCWFCNVHTNTDLSGRGEEDMVLPTVVHR